MYGILINTTWLYLNASAISLLRNAPTILVTPQAGHSILKYLYVTQSSRMIPLTFSWYSKSNPMIMLIVNATQYMLLFVFECINPISPNNIFIWFLFKGSYYGWLKPGLLNCSTPPLTLALVSIRYYLILLKNLLRNGLLHQSCERLCTPPGASLRTLHSLHLTLGKYLLVFYNFIKLLTGSLG